MPERYDFDLLCIGSGPAGKHAAIQATKLGERVAVVEREPLLGGVCVITGTIPSKTFREAVLSFVAQDTLSDGQSSIISRAARQRSSCCGESKPSFSEKRT